MVAPECWVVGCGSSAFAVRDVTLDQPHQGWSRLPGHVEVCNLHAEELKDSGTEWMLVRDDRALYLGHGLRKLNEYIILGVEGMTGYGTAREFSNGISEDGNHLRLRVRRRGDQEKEMVLVVPSREVARELKNFAGYMLGE